MSHVSRISPEQQALNVKFAMQDEIIKNALTPAAVQSIPEGARAAELPFKIADFQPNKVPFLLSQIRLFNSKLINAQWNYHYTHNLNRVRLTHSANDIARREDDTILQKVNSATENFWDKFTAGQVDIRSWPLPSKPTFVPQEGEYVELDGRRAHDRTVYSTRLLDKFNAQRNKTGEFYNESLREYSTLVNGVGSLYKQVQFCSFIQKTSRKSLEELNVLEFSHLRSEFQRLEKERELLASVKEAFVNQPDGESNASVHLARPKKKKKKKKAKKAVAAIKPALVAVPAAMPVPKAPAISQETVDLCLRLNHFNDYNGCAPHTRLQRWGAISLAHSDSVVKIKNFIDFDGNNQPKRLYAKCTLDELRLQKANHDIPIHTIMREEKLVADYSISHSYTNKRGEQRENRVFYAEKLSHNEEGVLCVEEGLIHTAVNEGVVYHCMFKKTKNVELQELTRQHADPVAEEVGDEKEEEGVFQFQGNYQIEIDPADQTLVMKIGQDGDLNQVIYRIYRN